MSFTSEAPSTLQGRHIQRSNQCNMLYEWTSTGDTSELKILLISTYKPQDGGEEACSSLRINTSPTCLCFCLTRLFFRQRVVTHYDVTVSFEKVHASHDTVKHQNNSDSTSACDGKRNHKKWIRTVTTASAGQTDGHSTPFSSVSSDKSRGKVCKLNCFQPGVLQT